MPAQALVAGTIPFWKEHTNSRKFLTPESFPGVRVGNVPACWRHWKEGDHVFSNKAMWAVTGDGLYVMVWLDLRHEAEVKAYTLARVGQLYFSFGHGSTPEETRAAVARWQRIGAKVQPANPEPGPYGKARVEHWSLGPVAAFPQQPAEMLAEI